MKRKKLVLKLGVGALILSIYPLFVLSYTWTFVARSSLEGGHNGPLDAYRHTLASAVVSYTLDAKVVNCVSLVMESWGKESNAMDAHNNNIGAQLGTHAVSFTELEPSVRETISKGMINAVDVNQTTWMPKKTWQNRRFW